MDLNPISQSFAAQLRTQLPDDTLRAPEPRYLEEPRGRFFGAKDSVLALPRDVQEVATIVRACNAARVGIVPFGGGTGLVGGQVMGQVMGLGTGPLADQQPAPLILSLERMNHIRSVYPLENILIAEAGTILAEVQSAAEQAERLFPLSLAAEGSATIGGNLATNAGGVNVLRYGNARDLCLGLEVVLPSGEIWHGLTRLRKDNTGYDLRNLLIGAEGTLGIITAAALKMAPRPASVGTALVVVKNPSAALRLLEMARDHVGNAVSAFELIHQQGLMFVAETLPNLRQPFSDPPEWMVLVELGLVAGADAALEALFSDAMNAGLVHDGLVAQNASQRAEFWSLREHIPVANKRIGSISSHDISVPLGLLADFIEAAGAQLREMGDFRINCFGHLGDGNLHYNVFPAIGKTREDYEHLRAAIKDCVHTLVQTCHGSFSAEHGVGRLKTDDLERFGDPARLAAMRAIKAALDPNGIMNPGAVLRS